MNAPRAVLLTPPGCLHLCQFTLPSRTNKAAGVCTNNSHSGSHRVQPSGTRHSSLVTCTQVLSIHTVARSFALTQNSTVFFSIGSALFAKNHPGGGYGHQRGEREIPHMRSELRTRHGKPRHYKGRMARYAEGTMFRRLPGISDIVPLQRRKGTKQIRPGGSGDRGRWLSSAPGSFRRSNSSRRRFSRR